MHKLLSGQPGEKVLLLGNEAIARGAIEAGLAFASTYPGTPSSEISSNFFEVAQQSDLYFEYSTNEKVAMEVAGAAANSGVRSMCVMKHVGVNVAADALMALAYVGVKAGMVIVSADDPFMFSSQNEQDNRYYGRLAGLPVLEPSSAEEAKEMVSAAFDLSEKLQEPVILRTTTRINHSTGAVKLGEIKKPVTKGAFEKDPLSYVAVPTNARKLHAKLLKNLDTARKLSNESEYNFIKGSGTWGIICNSVSYNYVMDAVDDLDTARSIKVFHVGFSYPMPDVLLKSFLKPCEKVLVVEEGEPIMEESVKALAQEEKFTMPIKGKDEALFSRLYEFDPALVRKCIAKYFNIPVSHNSKIDLSDIPEVPPRPPNLCAGCPHRATFYAIRKAAQGDEFICSTDIGCYTLGFLPPLSIGDFFLCMGSSVGTAGGFSKATDKKVISVIGDSTFFHSGIPGLINGVFNNHNFTLLILDNETTAMTGHQPHPGVNMKDLSLEGHTSVSIERVVKAIGVGYFNVIRPFSTKKSIAAIKEALDFQGVSVIISKQICPLYAKQLKKLKAGAFYVTQKCKNHRDCINEIACPAFYIEDENVKINASMCVGCTLCAQICPEHAIMPVKKT